MNRKNRYQNRFVTKDTNQPTQPQNFEQPQQQQQMNQQFTQQQTAQQQQQFGQQQQQQQFNQNNQQQGQLKQSGGHRNSMQQNQTKNNYYPLINKRKVGPNKIDINSIPRPHISATESYQPIIYNAKRQNTLPPQSQVNYRYQDQGNPNPRFIRSTFNTLHKDPSVMNSTKIPFGLVVQPLADLGPGEETVPLVENTGKGPFRCSRCQAYINPFFNFIEGGSICVCNLCGMQNQVPDTYQGFGQQTEQKQPELYQSSYEFVVPHEYENKKISNNYLMICLELSTQSIATGIYYQALSSLTQLLDYIPCADRTDICIMTYDVQMNYYRISDDLSKEPQIITVTDLNDPIVMLPKQSLFINLQDGRERLDYLLEKLQKFGEKVEETISSQNQKDKKFAPILGSVLNNAINFFPPETGRIIAFSSQPPVTGYGALKQLVISEKDKNKVLPKEQHEEYVKIGQTCVNNKISIDLFLFGDNNYDLLTIAPLITQTGGELYFFENYFATRDGEKLHFQFARNLTRYCGLDPIMTVRASQGVNLNNYYTSHGKINKRTLDQSIITADKVISIILQQDEKIIDNESYIQFAILYTNPFGQRVVRIFNMCFTVTDNVANVYRFSDIDATLNILIRQALEQVKKQSAKQIQEFLQNSLVNILYNYRLNCASSSAPGQLILPEALKLLPLYFVSLFKQPILNICSHSVNSKVMSYLEMLSNSIYQVQARLYPKLYPISTYYENPDETTPGNVIDDNTSLPQNLLLSITKLDQNGIYLIDNGVTIYIYILSDTEDLLIADLFGVATYEEIDTLTSFPQIETDFNIRVNAMIEQLRRNKNSDYQNVIIVTESNTQQEQIVLNLLVEDEFKMTSSYGDFLCHIHKQIQQKYDS